MTKIANDTQKGRQPTRQEVADNLRRHSRNMLENLLKAAAVKPDNLTQEQEEELQLAIANAEALVEKTEEVASKIERGEETSCSSAK